MKDFKTFIREAGKVVKHYRDDLIADEKILSLSRVDDLYIYLLRENGTQMILSELIYSKLNPEYILAQYNEEEQIVAAYFVRVLDGGNVKAVTFDYRAFRKLLKTFEDDDATANYWRFFCFASKYGAYL